MLDRSRSERASPRSRAIGYGIGAALALGIAGWLTFAGVDYIIGGCDCHEPLFGDWYGPALIAVALPFYVASVLLAVRAAGFARSKS